MTRELTQPDPFLGVAGQVGRGPEAQAVRQALLLMALRRRLRIVGF